MVVGCIPVFAEMSYGLCPAFSIRLFKIVLVLDILAVFRKRNILSSVSQQIVKTLLTSIADAQHNDPTMIIPIIPIKKYLDDLYSDAGLSHDEIAKAVGLHRTTIWKLRAGIHRGTDSEYGVRIANLHSQVFRQQKETG